MYFPLEKSMDAVKDRPAAQTSGVRLRKVAIQSDRLR